MVHRAIACFLARKAEPASGLISQEPVTSAPGVTHEPPTAGGSGGGNKERGFDSRGSRSFVKLRGNCEIRRFYGRLAED